MEDEDQLACIRSTDGTEQHLPALVPASGNALVMRRERIGGVVQNLGCRLNKLKGNEIGSP